jgi:hypothetical protein
VSGTSTDHTSGSVRPIAGAPVAAYVRSANGEAAYFGSVATDANGQYHFQNVPNGALFVLYATAAAGYDQPCAATITVNGDATLDVELVRSDSPSPLTTVGSPSLSGMVFENTAEGRQPVVGAGIFYGDDLVMASTHSDAAGRYALCHLPTDDFLISWFGLIWALKTGYQTDVILHPCGDMCLDLELKR